ncbi:SusC/RagA family TonB-linked outer membrane protein [Bacteroidia bacterium]|nr:SusC/RagA family TonB-linked outer membrane protein [Bacteroidia bacterium]
MKNVKESSLRIMRGLICLLCACCFSFSALAQERKAISGNVIDEKGEAVIGASIAVKGTTTGTVADMDGNFSLTVAPDAVLVISYLGYKTQEVVVGNQTKIAVTLAEDVKALEEVVVVGYGTVKKSDLTGSVTSLTPKSFLDQPGSSVNSVLQGRAPGVVVRRGNGAPGSGSTIRIRGINSIMGNNDPLIVVDGNYGGMPSLYDIESIEILKDASATAIYGSRGANGVIIVTTKRGVEEGRNEVKIYSNVSFDHVPNRYDMMDAAEYADFNNQMMQAMGSAPTYSPDDIDRYRQHGGTNWQDEIFRTGITQSHKVVLTGGNKQMKYYISPYYSNTDGILINTSSKGYGLSAKVDASLGSRVSFQVEAGVSHGETLNPDLGSGNSHMSLPLQSALIWSPVANVFNEDGSYQVSDPFAARTMNPVLLTTLKDTRYSNGGSAVGNLKIKIIDGLELNAKASMNIGTGGTRFFIRKELNGNQANALQSNSESKSWLANAFLTYTKTFATKHQFSAMAGFEESQGESQNFSAEGNDLAVAAVDWYNLGLGKSQVVGSGYSNDALRSYFGRLTYNYGSRYYFTGTYRADGSSKFRGDNQFSYFPSFAVGWRLSEESFLRDTGIFQTLKLRGGWGVTGSQAVGPYATLSSMSASSTFSWGTDQIYTGYKPSVGGNPLLQWEETAQTDLGLDVSVLQGKLSLAFDYYKKNTNKLLSKISVPGYNGSGTISTNIGEIENEGFEVNINYVVLENKDWSYDVNLNGAHNRNNVVDIGEQERLWGNLKIDGVMPASPFIILPGYAIGSIYGYKYLGLWQQGDVVEARKFGQEPGDYRYEDVNGNNEYDSGDYQIIGNCNPKFTWGFNNHLSYKNWDLNVLFEGLHGRDILNLTYAMAGNILDNSLSVTSRAGKDRWSPENPYAEFSKPSLNNVVKPNSTQYLQDGSYVKLRNISLSYRFTKEMTRFANIRLALSAQNVFTFSKYKGYDPEVSSAGGSDTDAGIDWFAYPNPRSYTVSLTLEY